MKSTWRLEPGGPPREPRMSRKPLPKAIRRPLAKLRTGAAAEAVVHAEAPIVLHDLAASRIQGALPAKITVAGAAGPSGAASKRARRFAALRRSVANSIVDRHVAYAAVGGVCPVPILNVAAVTAVVLRMIKQLSGIYEVPFERDRTRSLIIGMVGGAAPTGLGVATSSTLAVVAPGPGFVGLAVSAVTAGALTRAIGMVFLENLEAGANPVMPVQPRAAAS
jgi:uncharacterized protein (DUF697 family)